MLMELTETFAIQLDKIYGHHPKLLMTVLLQSIDLSEKLSSHNQHRPLNVLLDPSHI